MRLPILAVFLTFFNFVFSPAAIAIEGSSPGPSWIMQASKELGRTYGSTVKFNQLKQSMVVGITDFIYGQHINTGLRSFANLPAEWLNDDDVVLIVLETMEEGEMHYVWFVPASLATIRETTGIVPLATATSQFFAVALDKKQWESASLPLIGETMIGTWNEEAFEKPTKSFSEAEPPIVQHATDVKVTSFVPNSALLESSHSCRRKFE